MRLPSISLVAVVAVGLLTAGCGSSGSKTTSTTDWVNGVCSSVATWQTSIKSSANSLKGGNLSQNSLKTAVGDMKSATDTLQSDLKDLGKPDSDAGQKAKDSIDELTSELKKDTDTDEERRRRRLGSQQRRDGGDHHQHHVCLDGNPGQVDLLEPQAARPQGRAEDRVPAVELLQEALELELARATLSTRDSGERTPR